jgi:hypothetical protein
MKTKKAPLKFSETTPIEKNLSVEVTHIYKGAGGETLDALVKGKPTRVIKINLPEGNQITEEEARQVIKHLETAVYYCEKNPI